MCIKLPNTGKWKLKESFKEKCNVSKKPGNWLFQNLEKPGNCEIKLGKTCKTRPDQPAVTMIMWKFHDLVCFSFGAPDLKTHRHTKGEGDEG